MIAAILIYLLTIILFFISSLKFVSFDEQCLHKQGQVCVRICCFDQKFCDEEFTQRNFDRSRGHRNKFVFGQPKCMLEKLNLEDQWTIDTVSWRDFHFVTDVIKCRFV